MEDNQEVAVIQEVVVALEDTEDLAVEDTEDLAVEIQETIEAEVKEEVMIKEKTATADVVDGN
jgi:hypothetical protein